jgi:flagellar biosynthetic protein FlhB
MSESSGEKTEEPTQKKIDDSRKQGQVWKSKDLTGVAVFLVGLGAVKVLWPTMEGSFRELFAFSFETLSHPDDLEGAIPQMLSMALTSMLLLSVPVAFGAALVGGLVEFLQVGPLFSHEALMPKLDKLNPVSGMKNLVSKKQFVELLKNLLKITVTGWVVWGAVRDALGMLLQTVRHDVEGMLIVMGELVTRVSIRVGLLLLVFGIFDVWWQRKSYYKDLMMTKEEVKKEYKESEGDPHHKAKRKELHQEILESAQMEAVKGADVVVTNPDHVAVALRYDREKDGAPRVLAKGIDARAEAIKALARDAEVPTLRNVPLAHALLRVDVNDEVPEALYDAVAEVLNFVYGLKSGHAA